MIIKGISRIMMVFSKMGELVIVIAHGAHGKRGLLCSRNGGKR